MYVNTWKLSEDSLQMSYLDSLVLYKQSSALRRGCSVGSNIFYPLIFWRKKKIHLIFYFCWQKCGRKVSMRLHLNFETVMRFIFENSLIFSRARNRASLKYIPHIQGFHWVLLKIRIIFLVNTGFYLGNQCVFFISLTFVCFLFFCGGGGRSYNVV